jgi:hypothetical protein
MNIMQRAVIMLNSALERDCHNKGKFEWQSDSDSSSNWYQEMPPDTPQAHSYIAYIAPQTPGRKYVIGRVCSDALTK